MTEWLFKLGIPGPLVPTSAGNFPVVIRYLSSNTFRIVSGTNQVNQGDTIIITNSPINGTYLVGTGSTTTIIPVTPAIAFFTGDVTADIEIIRPASTIQETVIEEPIGFDDIVFNVQRDELWHGVFFEASTSQLGFFGLAYSILKGQKESYGFDAIVTFTALSRCEGETDYTEVISGKLNFGKYQDTCGDQCLIRLAVEQNNCAMVFKNRFDQKVDIDNPVAFDKRTNLVQYDGLRFTMPLATQVIPISADADVSETGDTYDLTDMSLFASAPPNHQNLLMRPTYARVNDNSILTGYLDDPANVFQDPDNTFMLTPQVLLEDNPGCILNEFQYDVRLKGSLSLSNIVNVGNSNISLWAILDYWDGVGTHTGPGNLTGNAIELGRIETQSSISGVTPNLFDVSFAGSVALPVGSGIYAYMKVVHVAISPAEASVTADYAIQFDAETSFLLTNTRNCPPTDAQVYLINETLARVTESITDRCLTIESEYYGRTDSEPYSEDADGCGSLRVLTPGLRIRQAPDKNFFASMKEIMLGLRAIDNIGMGMETDRIRIEPARWFYKDEKIMDILFIPKAVSNTDDQRVYSNIKSGYNKWEIKSIKGIDEFNSYKERRTGIQAINNELDISTDLIGSGYIIENLRTQTLLNTGSTDNTYDNDVFIICVQRSGYSYVVEQGITENASDFFSPATAYNWRIRPLYNLMRWFKSIAQSYVNLLNTDSKIFFTSGKGNYLAEGEIHPYDLCRLEAGVLAENADISASDFQDIAEAIPIYKPETITFTYPLSIADYKRIKAKPYGYINVQCGANGAIEKTWIKTIEYKPAEGTADFTLLKAWV